MSKIVTATVDNVVEMDIAANMPQEQVVEAVAIATTVTEDGAGGT